MEPIRIQVECYSGYKADESPRRFICEDTEIEVERILDRWLAAGKNAKEPKADYFKVTGIDGHDYLLKHDLNFDLWFLENRW
jgi:hypothetical protein